MLVKFITTNKHKFAEASELCSRSGIQLSMVDLDYEEARADTCEQVVLSAINILSGEIKPPFIIEDSGLFVRSLNGFPGTYSAYVLKAIGLDGMLKLMRGNDDRSAKFVSVIGYWDGNKPCIFSGSVEGEISSELRGAGGFGYDPLFIPKGYKFTFAENMSLKAKLSHRIEAFRKFILHVKGENVW